MLIGSQPLEDHGAAFERVLDSVPRIPNWAQLPVFSQEGMLAQFAEGLPGLVRTPDRLYVDALDAGFDEALTAFYEDYLGVTEAQSDWEGSCFTLTPAMAPGFFTMMERLASRAGDLFAVKGQVTGPITFTTGIKDGSQRAIFYHETLRDAAVKLLALKAAWQVRQLRRFEVPVIVFIDEPALAGYGSSEFIGISREQIATCLAEVIDAIHGQGALSGVHVCANTDWSILLDAQLDIVNFDAYGYFDKLLLYRTQLKAFMDSGRCLAWGMVPTAEPAQIEAATLESVWQQWQSQSAALAACCGLDAARVRRQALITPSCGTGSLSVALSDKVLRLTRELSARIRQG